MGKGEDKNESVFGGVNINSPTLLVEPRPLPSAPPITESVVDRLLVLPLPLAMPSPPSECLLEPLFVPAVAASPTSTSGTAAHTPAIDILDVELSFLRCALPLAFTGRKDWTGDMGDGEAVSGGKEMVLDNL